MPLINTITLPKTIAELSISHTFNAFIYPQQLAQLTDLSALILNVNNNNLFNGVTKVSKDFTKSITQRYSLNSPYESSQTIISRLGYALTMDKVVFYNRGDTMRQILEIESNGFIKQFVPFIIQETVMNPDRSAKETILYLDVIFDSEKTELDLDKGDLLVVKTLTAKAGRTVTIQNDFVGVTKTILDQALGTVAASQVITSITDEAKKLIDNFTL